MTNNTTFSALINTPITIKKKNAEGKYDSIVTTVLQDNFAHCPKASDCTNDGAKSALNSLTKVYNYMETASTARTDNQRDKAMNKAHDYAKEYLKAVGLSAGIGNITMLTALYAPKRQTKTNRTTKEKTVVGGYTTKSTFIKYALFLTNHVIETGAWCDIKTTNKTKKDENAELWAQMEENKKKYEAQKAQSEAMYTFIMTDPKLKAAFELMTKNA